jgi:hypothetical protein
MEAVVQRGQVLAQDRAPAACGDLVVEGMEASRLLARQLQDRGQCGGDRLERRGARPGGRAPDGDDGRGAEPIGRAADAVDGDADSPADVTVLRAATAIAPAVDSSRAATLACSALVEATSALIVAS